MKIGIITFTEGSNYGNKLQNYALLTFLNKLYEAEVVTVRNRLGNNSLVNTLKYKVKWLIPSKRHLYYWKRDHAFSNFNKQYLNFSKKNLEDKSSEIGKYDYLVCGSDQIWNPYYYEKIDLLCGKSKENIPAISYSASFGVDQIPVSQKTNFSNAIKSLLGISVREEQGMNICLELGVKKKVHVHLDPTMLLTYDEWSCLLTKPKRELPTKYVATYFIGQVPNSVKLTIEEYCKKNKCEIVSLNSINSLSYYAMDPFEFLYTLFYSDIIFTDSFHASVFSIIFNKKFIVCDRIINAEEKMNSRIDTLLSLFDLKNNRYSDKEINYDNLIVDSKKKDAVLLEGRNRAKTYFEYYIEKNML